MTSAAWRRLGVSPVALGAVVMATIALLLSRGAGSGWLVVLAAGFLGVVAIGVLSGVAGALGVAVAVVAPSDAVAGEAVTVEVHLRSRVPQLRTVRVVTLDGVAHALVRGTTTLSVAAGRRRMVDALEVEIRSGVTLGVLTPVRRFGIALATPLAIAPRPAAVSLATALGHDVAAEVRSLRPYVAGDAARLVHWRSTARRGELMVRELEAVDARHRALHVRVQLTGADAERDEDVASRGAGLAIAALDAGWQVRLLTHDVHGPRTDAVRTRRDVGRVLAAALAGEPPPASSDEYVRVVDCT